MDNQELTYGVAMESAPWMTEGGEVTIKYLRLDTLDSTGISVVLEAPGLARLVHIYSWVCYLSCDESLEKLIRDSLQGMLDQAYGNNNEPPPQITKVNLIECEMTPTTKDWSGYCLC